MQLQEKYLSSKYNYMKHGRGKIIAIHCENNTDEWVSNLFELIIATVCFQRRHRRRTFVLMWVLRMLGKSPKFAKIHWQTHTNMWDVLNAHNCTRLLLTTSVQQINLHKHMRLCVYICIFPYVTGILCNSQNNHRFAVYQTVWHYPSNGVNIKAQPLRWVKFVWGNFPCEIWCEWLWTSVEQLQILY